MELALHLLQHEFRVSIQGAETEKLLSQNFSKLRGEPSSNSPTRYHVNHSGKLYILEVPGQPLVTAETPGEFLYLFEHQLVIDLQKSRPDLFFIHAAVLWGAGQSIMLVAASGTGKSTMALAMVERGFGYLSDELAPIDLSNGWVHSYAHALCLKQVPPGRDAYPPHGFTTNRSWHLPADHLNPQLAGARLGILLFLERGCEQGPIVQEISQAEAVARLLPQVLNSLAHPPFGLDAAMGVVGRCRSLLVRLGDVEETADLLTDLIKTSSREPSIERQG